MKYARLLQTAFASILASSVFMADNSEASSPLTPMEVECMAMNLYHEARGEPLNGMIAVAQATLYRVDRRYWPNSICDVVLENRSTIQGMCQYSWSCDFNSDVPFDQRQWTIARAVSRAVLANRSRIPDLIGGTAHYVRCGVETSWTKKMEFFVRVGDHCFYREDRDGNPPKFSDPDASFALVLKDFDASISDVNPGDFDLIMITGNRVSRLSIPEEGYVDMMALYRSAPYDKTDFYKIIPRKESGR